MAISELLRFTLPRSFAGTKTFHAIRSHFAQYGAAKQYFGYVLPDQGVPLPQPKDQMCWFIEWSEQSSPRRSAALLSELSKIADGKPTSLRFEFTETKAGGVARALESNVTEFAKINLAPKAPRSEPAFEESMHRTFTDCYLSAGFTDGGWGYALNSNDPDGLDLDAEEVPTDLDRSLAFYPLGWENLEAHHAYAKTELFDVEINKLMPYFGPGTGAFYVNFEKHV